MGCRSSLSLKKETQLFLRDSSSDLEKLLSPLMKESVEKILDRYSNVFDKFNTQLPKEK